ncbi:MAG: hypothetical protein ACLUQ6_09375 [Alistipes onderdonkii]
MPGRLRRAARTAVRRRPGERRAQYANAHGVTGTGKTIHRWCTNALTATFDIVAGAGLYS